MRTSASVLRHPTRAIAALAAVLSLAVTAGCAAKPAAISPASRGKSGHSSGRSARPVAAASAASRGQPAVGPYSASFVSGSVGWLLATSPAGSKRIALRRTGDGGRHWSAAPMAGLPRLTTDQVSSIWFADRRDGWLFGPALFATHDGGASWHRVSTRGAQVASLTSGHGRVVATLSRCGTGCSGFPPPPFTVYSSPLRVDQWRPEPAASGKGFAQVAVDGRIGYAAGSGDAAVGSGDAASANTVLVGQVNGSAPWQRRTVPCPRRTWRVTDIAAGPAGVVLACSAGYGAHPVRVRVYFSADHGRTWQLRSHLYLQDGVDSLSLAPDGLMAIAGMYNGLLISGDGGRSWHRVANVDNTDAVGGGDVVQAAMTNDRDGFMIALASRIWFTRDAGRTWTPATIH